MSQHIPNVNRADVERVATRDFPADKVSQIFTLLSRYGIESYHQEIDRVHLDILKLADGDLDRVSQEVENACCDFRDTILAAEYPNYGKKMFQIDKFPPEERRSISNKDKEQYELWLRR